MTLKSLRILASGVFLLPLFARSQYAIEDLGVLGSINSNLAINSSGAVAGTTSTQAVFRWTNGSVEVFPIPGSEGRVTDINDSGDIAGYAVSGSAVALSVVGTVVTTHPGTYPGQTTFMSVNNQGVFAGENQRPREPTGTYFTPAIFNNGWTNMSLPSGATHGRANDINIHGVVVGGANDSGDNAFLWVGGNYQHIPNPGPNSWCQATKINDSGEIIVVSTDYSSRHNYYLYSNSGFAPLVAPDGKQFLVRHFTNNRSMVGRSNGELQTNWLRRPDGSYFNLTDFFFQNSNYVSFSATSVNDDGQIVAYCLDSSLNRRYVRLTPLPFATRPTDFSLLAGSLLSGNLSSLYLSDNDSLSVLPDETTLAARVAFDASSPVQMPSSLTFSFEGSVTRYGLSQTLYLRNYATGGLSVIDGRVAPTADATIEVTLTGSAANYVGPFRAMQAVVAWQTVNDEDPAQDGWLHIVDRVHWIIN